MSSSRSRPCLFLYAVVCLIATRGSCATDVPDINAHYHFTLTKGKGLPVCKAYVQRLNAVNYYKEGNESSIQAPYCGRPENDAVAGFVRLNRVPVTADEANKLLVQVFKFTHPLTQVPDETFVAPGGGGVPIRVAPLAELQEPSEGSLPIWRYDPQVNIENNGKPLNILVWQGFGANESTRVCGGDYGHGERGPFRERAGEIAYIVTPDGTAIDQAKTQAVFGHPSGGYLFPMGNGKEKFVKGFNPLGTSISIFKYRDLYYFDAVFGGWGDYDGKRGASKDIENTFGLFLRKSGKTREMCEVLMRDGDEP